MNKLYPSSVAPVFGITTDSYKESCPRYFAMQRELKVPQPEIDSLYKAVGRLAEERARNVLEAGLPPHWEIAFEVPVKYELAPKWTISGRVDMVVTDLADARNNCVWEVKSIISTPKTRRIMRGEVDVRNLGQLITYMAILRIPKGVLSYYAMAFNGPHLEFKSRDFRVTLDGSQIYIDDKLWTSHTVSDYMRFYALMMDSVDQVNLPAMTLNARACAACPFNITCNTNPKSKEEFKTTFQYLGEGPVKAMPTPRIPVIKQHRGKST